LLGRFQIASILGLLAHALHGIHHIALLRQKRVAQIGGPLDVVCETLYNLGQPRKRLNAWIPGLLGDGVAECSILQPRIPCQPLLELYEFERIRGGCEGLG
jgi:hypothetical protein